MKICKECFWFKKLVYQGNQEPSGFGRCMNPKSPECIRKEVDQVCNKTNYREEEEAKKA